MINCGYARTGTIAAVLVWNALAGLGQTAPLALKRTANGKPDLNGVWQAMNTANWDLLAHGAMAGAVSSLGAIGAVPPGESVVEGDVIPYLPAAAAKKKENFARRWTDDPEIKCYMPGVPRATYMPYPFQIVQGTTRFYSPTPTPARCARFVWALRNSLQWIAGWVGPSGDGKAIRWWWT